MYFIQDLYRYGYLIAKTDGVSTGFECPASTYDEIPSRLEALVQGPGGKLTLSDEEWELWRDFICDG